LKNGDRSLAKKSSISPENLVRKDLGQEHCSKRKETVFFTVFAAAYPCFEATVNLIQVVDGLHFLNRWKGQTSRRSPTTVTELPELKFAARSAMPIWDTSLLMALHQLAYVIASTPYPWIFSPAQIENSTQRC
jgi:hypothetical protein